MGEQLLKASGPRRYLLESSEFWAMRELVELSKVTSPSLSPSLLVHYPTSLPPPYSLAITYINPTDVLPSETLTQQSFVASPPPIKLRNFFIATLV